MPDSPRRSHRPWSPADVYHCVKRGGHRILPLGSRRECLTCRHEWQVCTHQSGEPRATIRLRSGKKCCFQCWVAAAPAERHLVPSIADPLTDDDPIGELAAYSWTDRPDMDWGGARAEAQCFARRTREVDA